MSRTKSVANIVRDADIIARARKGVPRRDIAQEFKVSEARVSQIITANLDPRYPDQDLRSWLLEGYYGDLEVLQEIKESPGRPITSGRGDHVLDVHGEPAYDAAVRVDAVRTAAQVRANIAKLTGTEKPPPPKPTGDNQEILDLYQHFDGVIKERDALKELVTQLQAGLAALENSVPAEIVSGDRDFHLHVPVRVAREEPDGHQRQEGEYRDGQPPAVAPAGDEAEDGDDGEDAQDE